MRISKVNILLLLLTALIGLEIAYQRGRLREARACEVILESITDDLTSINDNLRRSLNRR